MKYEQAVEIVCNVAEEWAGEYGFVMPEFAREVFEAADIVRAHHEL